MYRLAKSWNDLLLLRHVVQHGSINRAASAANLSQPALTRKMHRLEQMLGIPLLDRNVRGITPTPCAKALLDHLEIIDFELAVAWQQVELLRTNTAGFIRVGCTPAMLNQLVPATIERFQKGTARSRVQIVEALPAALIGMLRRAELDLIVYGDFQIREDSDLSHEVIHIDQTGLFVRKEHPLAARTKLSLSSFASSYSWIFPDPSSQFHKIVEAELARLGVQIPDELIETPSTLALQWLLRETDRIAVTGGAAVAIEVANASVIMLTGDWILPEIKVVVSVRTTETESTALAHMIESFREAANTRL